MQIHYPIHTKIEDNQFFVAKLLHQSIPVRNKILFPIKLVIHMTVRYHMPYIKGVFQEINKL